MTNKQLEADIADSTYEPDEEEAELAQYKLHMPKPRNVMPDPAFNLRYDPSYYGEFNLLFG